MISSDRLFGCALASFVLIVIPGPSVLFVVGRAIGLVSGNSRGAAASFVRSWLARSDRRFAMAGGAGGLAMTGVGVTVALTGRQS